MSGDTTARILARQISEALPPMITARPDLPPALAEAIDRCVEKEAGARFQSAEALVESLDAAQLAAPEIPIAVRMFAQEASTLNVVLLVGGFLALVMIPEIAKDRMSNIDNLLPLVLIFGVLATRVLQTLSEARRLAFAGFTPSEVHRGLAAVMDERAARRSELKADERTRRARRITVRWAVVMFLMSLAMMRLALTFRTKIAEGSFQTAPPGTALVLSGMALLGISLVLLLRSPFRMPVTERIFRWVWLGPVGRAFLRAASRRVKQSGGRATVSSATTNRAAVATPAPAQSTAVLPAAVGDRVSVLEKRVEELERWRKAH